jgi:HCOMODA/2-hydroxy-3-carboxy-muconic semialdehyde decarboxylase
VFRAVYTEVNAKLMLQALPLGELSPLTPEEADATRITNEGQAARPWELWREQARRSRQERDAPA